MARGKMGVDHRPNTLKENKRVLCELRNRIKIDRKNPQDLNKLLAKLNSNSARSISKNAKASLGIKQANISLQNFSINQNENPYGPIDGFPSGSWWGIRMDCSRDRVHKPFNKDIQEGPHGVVSLCTSHLNIDNDVDLGDFLTFTADEYTPGVKCSHPLLLSYQNQAPLRLIRSYNLGNVYAPKTGYRYDGLYTVIAWWISVTSTTVKHYKFALTRLPNQDPPVWNTKLSHRGKNQNTQQTRYTGKRTSNNRPSDWQNNVHEQKARNNLRTRAGKTKYALKKSTITQISCVDGVTSATTRNDQESGIVTRCISYKKIECHSGSGMVSVPYADSSSLGHNRLLENSPKSALCKLQNTNISIRTDLYDSSNGLQHQQDTRRVTPMTFSCTYKSSRVPARINNHSNVVTLNLNSCGPCPRDNTQESLIQSRSGIGKFLAGQSPSSDSNRSLDRSTPNRNHDRSTPKSTITPTECKTIFNDNRTNSPVVNSIISEIAVERCEPITDTANKDKSEKRIIEKKQQDDEKSPLKVTNIVKSSELIVDKESQDNETTGTKFTEKIIDNMSLSINETRDEPTSKESRNDLDSLTPDQMLNFIVKQKYHPKAKLLIGSVIGLATGESTILRAYESLMSRKNHWTSEKMMKNDENEITRMSENDDESTIVDSREKDFTNLRDETNVSTNVPKKRVLGDGNDRLMKSMRPRRTRVSKTLLETDKKSSTKNNCRRASRRLRKSDLRETKSQKPFSKSTILKKSKKRAKKRRSELANLVIDANVGPIIRGPRNRRLRCMTHYFTKKRRSAKDTTNCCAVKTTEIGAKAKLKEIARVEMSTRKSNRSNSTEKGLITKSRYTKKRSEEPAERNYREECKIRATKKGEKRKLSNTRDNSNKRESIESTKRLCNDNRKNVEFPRIVMVDAATQCTSRRDASASCIDDEIDETDCSGNIRNSMKIEWIDLDDVKSEVHESDDNDDSIVRSLSDGMETFQVDIEAPIRPRDISTRPEANESTPRLSAFVPVNISDNDFRIARLRSIGFKPITPTVVSRHNEKPTGSSEFSSKNSAVISREVDELFNKYTSEETTIVGYMDQELRYEDIENEGGSSAIRKRRNTRAVLKGGKKIAITENKKNLRSNMVETGRDDLSIEEDSEVPWHGWKKFVNDKQEHWIGW